MLDFLMESDFAVEINEEEGFLNNRMEAQKLARQCVPPATLRCTVRRARAGVAQRRRPLAAWVHPCPALPGLRTTDA